MSDPPPRLTSALGGRYQIERQLGEGGMATVYLAEDLKHHRRVALKVLKPELAAVVGAERFLAEIETTAKLQHPHILPLFDSGHADSFLYYVMPYVEGESLRDRLDREHQLPVDEALDITGKVASALQYAHEQGVVHRDIKPANILLSRGEPLVADFGIALAVSQAGDGRLTETGLSLGTPHYMSPEQAVGERRLDPRSDVYALACVAYEMLTGQPPFGGANAQAVLAHILTGQPEPPTAHRPSVPAHAEAALLKALERLPADRFQSAGAFAAALHTPSQATPTGPVTRTGGRAAATSATSARSLVPWVVAAVAVMAAAASWLTRAETATPRPLWVELEPPAGAEFSENRFAALSPDGTQLAFVGLRPTGGRVLWIRELETGRADSLHAANGAQAPFWSPDGRSIGYFAYGSLWRIQADGSAVQRLCDTPDIGGSWSGRGVILFTRLRHPMTVSASGGPCTPIEGAWADSTQRMVRPAWLPDDSHFAGLTRTGAVVSDVTGAAPRSFIPGVEDVQLVAPDIAVFAKHNPTSADILAQRYDPKNLTLVGSPTTLVRGVRTAAQIPSYSVSRGALVFLLTARTDAGPLVADARGVVVGQVKQQGSWTLRLAHSHPELVLGGNGLWLYDLERGTAVAIEAAGGWFGFPVWSPGDSLLAVARLLPHCSVLLLRLRAGTDTTIIHAPEESYPCPTPTDWTSDGRFLLLTIAPVASPDRSEIWTYDLATGALTKLVSVEGAASAGVVSPDRRWLAYVSNETGELEVYVRPFLRSGAAVGISSDGGGTPRWSGDGRALFYIAPDGRVVRVPMTAGADLQPGNPETLFHAPRWSMRLFADQARGQQLTTPFDVSPDGQRFFIRQRSEVTSAATLVENWEALLAPTHP